MAILAPRAAGVQTSLIARRSRIAYNGAMGESILDRDDTYSTLDSEGLLARIDALPEQIAEAYAVGHAFGGGLPPAFRDVDRVIITGMGGSGIGGALLRGWALDVGAKTPIDVVRGYGVPAYTNARTLVIASSNSGNTEETVAAFGEALAKGAQCIAVATGGALLESARAAANSGAQTLAFGWDGEPRSALGWSFASLLGVAEALGLVPQSQIRAALDEARETRGGIAREVPEGANMAKQLARQWHGGVPVIVGAQALAPVAYRWRTQVNENAKSWAIAEELPEMNHNAQTNYGLPAEVVPLLRAVFLRHAAMHPRVRLRVDATAAAMREANVAAEIIEVEGSSLLAQMLRAVLLGDYASYYLGLLNDVHPSPVPALGRLKDLLASG